MSDELQFLLRTTGIHQIAVLPDATWKQIKRGVRSGKFVKVEDYGFPRLTYRYFTA